MKSYTYVEVINIDMFPEYVWEVVPEHIYKLFVKVRSVFCPVEGRVDEYLSVHYYDKNETIYVDVAESDLQAIFEKIYEEQVIEFKGLKIHLGED